MGRHVVVEGLERPGCFLPAAEPLQHPRGSGQCFTPEFERPLRGRRLQMHEGLFARPGARQAASEIETQAVLVPVVGEFVEYSAEKGDPFLSAHSGKTLSEQMQGVRRQLTAGELGGSQPLFGFRPPASPESVSPEPVGGRGPASGRERGVIGDRA